MNRTLFALLALAFLGCALPGCSTRTDVSATGNTPAKYAHVWLTAQEVWFNASAVAGPDDGGWVKFPLSTPVTVDLVADSGGNLASIVTGLNLAPASYAQLRLIPLDASAALTDSAQTLGALYNAEADFVDSAGTTHQLPLELLNPAQGIGIQGSLKVPVGNVGAALGATAVTASATTASTTPITPTTPTTSDTTATPPSTTATSTTTITSFALSLDGARDLTPFTYGSASAPNAILFSSHAAAFDLSESGAISGQLTLTNLTGIAGASGLPAIQVSAEALSADGTRHVVVNSAPVHADGSFLLYPLATNASTPVDYDLVIHGVGIATIIVKTIPVTLASSTTGTASTVSTAATGSTPAINPVSVGTLIPRAASPYPVNLNAGGTLPAGAQVIFYQTLASAGEVPYAIASSPIDPFNQVLADDQMLSAGTLDSGTFSSTAGSVTLVSAAPTEGSGRYVVAASAPSYSDGTLMTLVPPPPSGTTTTVKVSVPRLSLAPGAAAGTLAAVITMASAGKYDHGDLLLAHDGALIATTPLDAALAGGASVTLTGVPTGTADALYYLSVRAWNSRDPSGTLHRQSYATAIDLRGSTSGSIPLTID